MILDLILDGFDAALTPCSFILVIPGLACLLTARQESTSAAFGFSAAVAVGSWLRFSRRLERPPDGILALAVGAALVALAIPLLRRVDLFALGGGGLAGAACSFMWAPCGGPALAELLGELDTRGLDGGGLLAVHLLALLAPVILVALALHLIPGAVLVPVRPVMLLTGSLVLGTLALTVAAGLDDDLVVWLIERSNELGDL